MEVSNQPVSPSDSSRGLANESQSREEENIEAEEVKRT